MLRDQSIQDVPDDPIFHALSYNTMTSLRGWADRVIQDPFLPPEILSKIFVQTGAFLDISWSYPSGPIQWTYWPNFQAPLNQLLAILLVCKDWYDAARETKGLYQQRILLQQKVRTSPTRFLRYLLYVNPQWSLTIVLKRSTVGIFWRIFPILMNRMVGIIDLSGEMVKEFPFDDAPPAPKLEKLDLSCLTHPGNRVLSSVTISASTFPVL
jgi:hypothetical protein